MAKDIMVVATISSLEVAEMVEKRHRDLVRDIKKYSKYIEESNNELGVRKNAQSSKEDLGELNFQQSSEKSNAVKNDVVKDNALKIEAVKDNERKNARVEYGFIDLDEFWIDSTYLDKKGESRPCYNITKKGCEFIAHKCTGQKGVVFTARYINRFHELEENANKNRLIHVSDKPAPRAITFYKRNLSRIELFAKIGEFTKREAIDDLISYVSTRFDMEEATIQYIVDVGEKPRYRLDIFDYFPEIGKFGEEYLKFMIDFNLSSYAERRKKKNGSKEV